MKQTETHTHIFIKCRTQNSIHSQLFFSPRCRCIPQQCYRLVCSNSLGYDGINASYKNFPMSGIMEQTPRKQKQYSYITFKTKN